MVCRRWEIGKGHGRKGGWGIVALYFHRETCNCTVPPPDGETGETSTVTTDMYVVLFKKKGALFAPNGERDLYDLWFP